MKENKENFDSLREQCNQFKDIVSDLRNQLDEIKSKSPLNLLMMTTESDTTHLIMQDPTRFTPTQPIHCVSMEGHNIPLAEVPDICPLGYTFYSYFDSRKLKVKGKQINPFWCHEVTL